MWKCIFKWSPLYIEIILGTMRPKNGKVPTVTTTKAVNAAVINNAMFIIFHNLLPNYD